MTEFLSKSCDAAVIGAGPSGLCAAITLKNLGIKKVMVIDRETEAGGIPRHCGHYSFGLMEYFRPMTGPEYAGCLSKTARAAGVDLCLRTSVIRLEPGGLITAATPGGIKQIRAKRVVLATGARETPRSARLVSGGRIQGISTTGALQSMVYLKKLVPFTRPLVVGTEMVSFSGLLTCKKAGIKPVAIIESQKTPSVQWPVHHGARLLGVPLILNARVDQILGKKRVSGVRIRNNSGRKSIIHCDGILFTGRFTPESSLMRTSHLLVDLKSGSPVTDRLGRCSDPAYYACGNLLPPLNMAMNCWRASRRTAQIIANDLKENL